MPQVLKIAILGFVAGFFAVLIFHQSLWVVLYQIGMIPSDLPAWPMNPIPPFGVPSVISKAFWGGLWGAALAPLLTGLTGARYWVGWIVIGSLALALTAVFVVPPIKGLPIPELWPRLYYALLLNAAWGFGTALFLRLEHVQPAHSRAKHDQLT